MYLLYQMNLSTNLFFKELLGVPHVSVTVLILWHQAKIYSLIFRAKAATREVILRDKSVSEPLCLHLRNKFVTMKPPRVSLAKELGLCHDITVGAEKHS